MTSKKKQQSIADKTLREDPALNSASPDLTARARAKLEQYKRFSVGDLIVEETDVYLEQLSRNELRFGIIVSIHRDHTFSVRYVDGVDYTHASLCRLYSEWLADNR